MTFGESLKELRTSRGLSQRELGKRLGVSQQTIAQYERASFIPKAQTIQRLADALEISPDEFWIKTSGYPERDAAAIKELNELSSDDYFSLNEAKIIPLIKSLNDKGLSRAHNYLVDLTKIPEYRKQSADAVSTEEILTAHAHANVEQTTKDPDNIVTVDLTPNAAHAFNPTEEEKKHADEIMKDDSFWE